MGVYNLQMATNISTNMIISLPDIHNVSANMDSFFYIYFSAAILNTGTNDTFTWEGWLSYY